LSFSGVNSIKSLVAHVTPKEKKIKHEEKCLLGMQRILEQSA